LPLMSLRDRWGAVLFDFMLRGPFEHRLIHADPNLSNFSFLADGRVVVYDFGCVKSVPEQTAAECLGQAWPLLADVKAWLTAHKPGLP
jgi:predicted unusual protein kinase regulating ubiquinone biosynthesis (AarF/ABC1/UbiB family)